MTQFTAWTALSSSNFKTKHLQLSAVFGSPDRKCAGSGLCRLLPRAALKNWSSPCPIWPAGMIWHPQGTFILQIKTAEVAPQLLRDIFQEEHFVMEAPFLFPLWLCKKLGIQSGIVPSGIHPLVLRNNAYELILPWKARIVQPGFSMASFLRGVEA